MIKKTYAEIKRVPDAEDLLMTAENIRVVLYTAIENLEREETKAEGLALANIAGDTLNELISGLDAHSEMEHREAHIKAIGEILETPKDRRFKWDEEALKAKGISEDGRTAGEIMSEYADKVRRKGIVIGR